MPTANLFVTPDFDAKIIGGCTIGYDSVTRRLLVVAAYVGTECSNQEVDISQIDIGKDDTQVCVYNRPYCGTIGPGGNDE